MTSLKNGQKNNSKKKMIEIPKKNDTPNYRKTSESDGNDPIIKNKRKNKIIFDKKMTRKERKQELIRRTTESRQSQKKNLQKPGNKIKTDEPDCIFIIKHGKLSKESKNLLSGLRLVFQPHSNLKYEDFNVFQVEIFKKIIELYNIRAFFILKETKDHKMLKIYNVKDKTSYIFKIIDFDTNFVNKKFNQPALITYSGFNRVPNQFLQSVGKSTFDDTKNIKRVLNFNHKNHEISLRHFEITVQKTRCSKIGLKELGPKLDLVFSREVEGELDSRW